MVGAHSLWLVLNYPQCQRIPPKPRSNKHTSAIRVYTHLAHKLTIETHILNYSSHKISSLTKYLIFRGNVFNLPAAMDSVAYVHDDLCPKQEVYARDVKWLEMPNIFIEDNNGMISGVNSIIHCHQWCQWYHTRTLSSMVSNFVSSIPSMVLVVPSSEWSTRARLNLTSWSTASLPTSASPTKSTRSGLLTRISWMSMCVCVCVCAELAKVEMSIEKAGEREREREREREKQCSVSSLPWPVTSWVVHCPASFLQCLPAQHHSLAAELKQKFNMHRWLLNINHSLLLSFIYRAVKSMEWCYVNWQKTSLSICKTFSESTWTLIILPSWVKYLYLHSMVIYRCDNQGKAVFSVKEFGGTTDWYFYQLVYIPWEEINTHVHIT